ncbi:hypothetical protein HPB51_020020 [Rhipicephalus microplus]|uniref:Uncharacterized protein n=1 Tax=Rhipicephalus microplus TaxID=6941 RepID=A0A9J6EPS8_RHIMP|nr:hypothetical protein HPB51_020020 [Rhipicephalus microplus]
MGLQHFRFHRKCSRRSRDSNPRPAGQQPSTLATRPPRRGAPAAFSRSFFIRKQAAVVTSPDNLEDRADAMPSGGPSYGSYCCVSWCFNNGRTHKKPGTSFFRVPRDGSSVSRFYVCLDTVLHDQSCDDDVELMGPVEYFPRVLTHKYHNLCSAELGLTARQLKVKVLRALGSSDSSLNPEFGFCREEKAVREFFTCGLLFNVIVSSDPPKEKLCTAYVNLDKCTKDLQCSNKSEFNTHSKHVLDVLLSPYSDYCSGFVDGKNNSTATPPATPTAPTSPETPATTKAKCSESVQLEKYFHCGLVFIFNLRDAMFQNNSAQNSLACDLIRAHKLCIEAAMATPHCPDKIGISKILEYVDSELHAASGVKCPTVKRDRIARRQHRSSAHHCHVLQYASTYFTCGTMFLRKTYLDRPATGEACKLYYDFLKCVEELVVCRQQSDLLVSFNHFSEILTDGYKDACKGHNISGEYILLNVQIGEPVS